MKNPLITIIVPVYNVQDYVDKCIKSIVKQTYRDLEIILVDDGATDSSGIICDKWSRKDKRINVIHKENGGLSSARNEGIRAARGAYISFVDSDDYIHEQMYEILMEKMLNYEADISICNRYHVNENGRMHIYSKIKAEDQVMNREAALLEMNSFRSFDMSACGKLYKRKLFEKISFPKNRLSEDFYVMYRLFDLAERICYTSMPLYYYMQRQGSITKSEQINFDFINAAKEQMEYVEQKYPALTGCVHAAYASANMTVYNFYIKNHVRCNRTTKQMLKKEVRNNLIYIKQNQYLPVIKKIQGLLFAWCLPAYNIMFRLFKTLKNGKR